MARLRSQAGFTLMEILVVVFILGLLATLVAVNVGGHVDPAKRTTAAANIRTIANAVSMYALEYGAPPSTADGIAALVEAPERFLKSVPVDPWGCPYHYASDGRDFTVVSYGRDGQPGGSGLDEDISSDDLG